MNYKFKAALFDLDGVVLNTEQQYTEYWDGIFKHYFPNEKNLAIKIKGSTLTQIFDGYFAGKTELQKKITAEIDDFERTMTFEYIHGFVDFVKKLRGKGIKTAVVTSSNLAKMGNVYNSHKNFRELFDAILTSEDFAESKPSPDCYLRAAARFGLAPEDCVVFEDSFNGLKSGRAAGMYVVGLATTNAAEAIRPLCDEEINDYRELNDQAK